MQWSVSKAIILAHCDYVTNLVACTITNVSHGVNDTTPLVAETITDNWHHRSNGAKAGNNARIVNPVIDGYRVRRFTPLECERAQGFPDDLRSYPYSMSSRSA